MRYLSVCSGIEAASVAWKGFGWQPVAFSETEKFASAVLAERFPTVPNLGDLNNYANWQIKEGEIDLLVGGTPCQSFSVAGLHGGLKDPRGNLALVYLGLVNKVKPRWIVFENVPGLLSADRGKAFGSFLGALAELGYGWSYRVLDAQYVRVDTHPFAVPQRRRRLFLVGHSSGDARCAAKVLLEPESVRRNPPTRRKTRENFTGGSAGGSRDGSISGTVAAKWEKGTGGPAGDEAQNLVSVIMDPLPFDTTQITHPSNYSNPKPGDPCHPLVRLGHPPAVASSLAVRRLTPLECERLQGFPDNWTSIKYRGTLAKDATRYRAIGNSMAVNVMRWIGQRINQYELNLLSEAAGNNSLVSSITSPVEEFNWPPEVADPLVAREGKTYTHEGKNNFRLRNFVPVDLEPATGTVK